MLDTIKFRRSLAETITWYEVQKLPLIFERQPLIDNRKALTREFGALMQEAYKRTPPALTFVEWEKVEKIRSQGNSDALKTIFRSADFQPSGARTEAEWKRRVDEIVAARARLLQSIGCLPAADASHDLKGGRLLLYSPSENLSDGAAEVTTMGFFDADNVPPWDIWVHYSQAALISWVPPQLLSLTQDGIDVNPEGCIRWSG